jgi:hypothetical protein
MKISDRKWIIKEYKKVFGKSIDLNNPKTFNEKLLWLNINDRKKQMTSLVDKYAVRSFIKKKIGDHILNELYGVYENVDDIDINKLPNSFVLKANHGSGWNIICKDKRKIDLICKDKKKIEDWGACKKKLSSWLEFNYYNNWCEWAYKNVKPKIICEKFIESDSEHGLLDYKFFCFNGKPKYIQVDLNRFTQHRRKIYNLKWEPQPFVFGFPMFNGSMPKPKNLKEMIEYATKLSDGFKFVRVDFYSVRNKVIFCEMTFVAGAGFERLTPEEYDLKMGNEL